MNEFRLGLIQLGETYIRFRPISHGVNLVVSELGMNKLSFRTKSLWVDLYYVQDQFTWGGLTLGSGCIKLGRLGLGSWLGMNEFRFNTKSLGVDLYCVQD